RELALQRIVSPDDRAFRHIRVAGERLLDGAGGQAVAGDIDDVIGACHDEDIAVLIDVAGIPGLIVAGEGTEIGPLEALPRGPAPAGPSPARPAWGSPASPAGARCPCSWRRSTSLSRSATSDRSPAPAASPAPKPGCRGRSARRQGRGCGI